MDPLKRLETDAELSSLLQSWELLRTQHREIPAQAVTVLLYVASHNPCHKQAIEEDCNLTTASSSRMIDFLSGGKRPKVKKYEMTLIKRTFDPYNKRRIMLELTPKGEQFVKQIKAILHG